MTIKIYGTVKAYIDNESSGWWLVRGVRKRVNRKGKQFWYSIYKSAAPSLVYVNFSNVKEVTGNVRKRKGVHCNFTNIRGVLVFVSNLREVSEIYPNQILRGTQI